MFFKLLDILSPHITLYNKGFLYHSTIPSIILSVLLFCFLIIYIFFKICLFIFWRKPKITFYNNFFTNDYDEISLDSFSHFINIGDGQFDFYQFRIIGFETYLDEYINDRNIYNFNHWLYGPCGNINDVNDISQNDFINRDYFNTYACIKKYYDLKEKKYINIDELNFRWPVVKNYNVNKFYSIIIEKCHENTLKEIFNDNRKCIDNFENKNIQINFNFIDFQVSYYFDELIKTTTKTIGNELSDDNYLINNIYFNNLYVRDGYIINSAYSFDRNDIFIRQKNKSEENNIFVGYYIWMNEKCNAYIKTYITIEELIVNIHGISNVIIYIFIFVNKIFNKYGIFSDSKDLFSTFPKKINKKREIKLKNHKFNSFEIKKLSSSNKNQEKNINLTQNIYLESNNNIFEKNKKNSQNENINNFTYIEEKNYKNEISNIIANNDNTNNDNKLNNETEKLNFCIYLLYKLSCRKAYKYLKVYEDLEIKILSVENLFKIHLNINNLMKINNDNG